MQVLSQIIFSFFFLYIYTVLLFYLLLRTLWAKDLFCLCDTLCQKKPGLSSPGIVKINTEFLSGNASASVGYPSFRTGVQ